jgi:hypothetical protein
MVYHVIPMAVVLSTVWFKPIYSQLSCLSQYSKKKYPTLNTTIISKIVRAECMRYATLNRFYIRVSGNLGIFYYFKYSCLLSQIHIKDFSNMNFCF